MNEQAVWNKAHRKLKREVRRAHKRARNQTNRAEQALIDSGVTEEEALLALEEADRIERRVFRKKRKKLRKMARRESIAFDHYTEAEAAQAESFAVYVLED